jgi:hypothetical protein
MDPPLRLVVRGIAANLDTVTLSCGYADYGNWRYPRRVYTTSAFPGLANRG